MLNANAKAFVPGGSSVSPSVGGSTVVIPSQEAPFYRYSISVPTSRAVVLECPSPTAVNLSMLLSKRQITSVVKGGTSLATTQQYVTEFFSSLTNITVMSPATAPCGFLLSRELLSLSALDTVLEANERDGFLIHLVDIAGIEGVEVGSSVAALWEVFFSQFGRDFRITAFGYLYTQVQSGEISNFQHFFFACTTPKKSQLVQLTTESFFAVSRRAFEAKRLLPAILSASYRFAAILSFEAHNSPFVVKWGKDIKACLASIQKVETDLAQQIADRSDAGDTTEIVFITVIHDENEDDGIPFMDVAAMLSAHCESLMGAIIGVISSSQNWDLVGRGLLNEWRFEPGTSVQSIVEARVTVCPGTHVANSIRRFPSGLFATRATSDDYQSLVEENVFHLRGKIGKGSWLTRAEFANKVDSIATEQFRIRRRVAGVSVLLTTDATGRMFCTDIDEGNTVLCTANWSNSLTAPRSSVFVGTLAASFRGERQFQIIIHDVLKSSGTDVSQQPFTQRLSCLDGLGLDDESSWPHSTPSHLVVLRATFTALNHADTLLHETSCEVPSIGLDLCCLSKPYDDSSLNFHWAMPESLSVILIADEIETVSGNAGHRVRRAYLSCASNDNDSDTVMLQDEFVEFYESCAPEIKERQLIECMLRRVDDSIHWWDLLRVFEPQTDFVHPDTVSAVEAIVHSPMLQLEELKWLQKASNYVCVRCKVVDDGGKHNPSLKGYLCHPCWESTGHGDCLSCSATLTAGNTDIATGRFYCDSCWSTFTTSKSFAPGAPPPPPDATFSKQISTRVISLLVDRISGKAPINDVLELCCGGSVIRKWINAGTQRYVGVDNAASVSEDLAAIVKANFPSSSPSSPTQPQTITGFSSTKYDVAVGDAFSRDLWSKTIAPIHPSQFHIVTCFSGLQQCFSTEESARNCLFAISNALVPNGLFMGSITSANALFRKGRSFENSVFRSFWEDDASPHMGATYSIQLLKEDEAEKTKHVVPVDVLVALASEVNLTLLREYTLTFADLLAEDDRWTRALSSDEKEFLSTRVTFVFRKNFQKSVPKSPTSPAT